ncbi:MAG TPA: cupredoxin domain-containing protein [Ilumatobacteraceae bacterium]|nr:cupredoxin domain-containing protein [Ilumatobacteraceae bacterium]
MKRITASLVVCMTAASFTAGALLFADDSQPTTAANTAPPAVASPPAPGAPAVITIADFGFSPLTVTPGATVTVTNNDGAPHTVTAVGGEFATGLVDGGTSVAFVAPTQPGTYTYFCDVHPSMQGTLVVV